MICVLGCEPVQSRVWLLTLTFVGGSGGEGSAHRERLSEKTTVKREMAEILTEIIDGGWFSVLSSACMSPSQTKTSTIKIMAACMQPSRQILGSIKSLYHITGHFTVGRITVGRKQ